MKHTFQAKVCFSSDLTSVSLQHNFITFHCSKARTYVQSSNAIKATNVLTKNLKFSLFIYKF